MSKRTFSSNPGVIDYCLRTIYWVLYSLHLGWNFLRNPSTEGAYVAVWFDNEVLVIRNSYKKTLTLPCGGIKKEESIVAAAVRELFEETGIDVDEDQLKYNCMLTNNSEFKNDQIHVFDLITDSVPAVVLDGREVVSAEFLSIQAALAKPLFPPVREYLRKMEQIRHIP